MASLYVDEQRVNDQCVVSLNATAVPFDQAWKSVKRHFPDSCVEKNTDASTRSIILRPIQSVDLFVEFRFHEKRTREPPNINVRSEKLDDTFVRELNKILQYKCAGLTEWQSLGGEIETIMKCVDVRREKKVSKKNKKGKRGKDKLARCVDINDSNEELSVSLGAVPGLNFDWNSYCKQEEKKPRPNYFIALRIHDHNIRSNISKIQNSLVSKEELLSKGVIPNETLHLTLCNLGLDSASDLLSAMGAMNQMNSQLQELLPKVPVTVHSVSKFFNRAIYAKVDVGEDFHTFRNLLIRNLDKAGVEFREDHDVYNPHVTIIKVRRPERKAFGTRNIEPALYSEFLGEIHGQQRVDALYLCAMGGQKREDGFYVTACELHFQLDHNL